MVESCHGEPHVITWNTVGGRNAHENLKILQYFYHQMGGFQYLAFGLGPS